MIIAMLVADKLEMNAWGARGVPLNNDPFQTYKLKVKTHTVYFVLAGIGFANAAAATAYAIFTLKATRLINFGVVGATRTHALSSVHFPSQIYNLDVKTPWYPDGVTPYEPGVFPGDAPSGASPVKLGSSSSFVSQSSTVKSWIAQGVTLFDMEAAAMAQIAMHLHVPITFIKAVSDHLDATPIDLAALNAQIIAAATRAAMAAQAFLASLLKT